MKKLALFLILATCPAWATWTLTQVKSNNSCTTSSCSVTITAVTNGHLLGAGIIANSTGTTISSVTAGECSATWTHPANMTNCSASGDGSCDLFYCTNGANNGGATTISIATGGTACGASNGCIAIMWEAASTLGNIAIDSGATPSQSGTSASSTSPAGQTLNLSSNNHFVMALGACGDTCTGVTGTGCTNDLSNPNGDVIAHCISATSGSAAYPTTMTSSSAATIAQAAMAFQESSGGAAPAGFDKRKKLQQMGVL